MGPTSQTLQDTGAYAILDHLLEGCQVISHDWQYLYLNDAAAAHGRKNREELLGRTMMEAYPGIEHTGMFQRLKRCMEERLADELENEFAYEDGSTAWFELRIRPVPEGLFILSLDVSFRKHAERDMEEQIERLRSLRAIDVAILGTTDFRIALNTLLDEARTRLGADAALVLLLDPGMTRLESAASRGFRSRAIERISVRLGEGAIGRAALARRTVVVSRLVEAREGDPVATVMSNEGMHGCVAAPLVARGHVIGVLVAAGRAELPVTDDWIGFLEALAGQAAMAIDAGRSYEDLQRAHMELALAYETTIEGWSNALDLRDKETARHTIRVADLTIELARAAGIGEADLVHIRRGALLHDIGKMAVPDAILLKVEPLTPEEQAVIQKHPVYAYELLSPIPHLKPALDIPYCHHEKWDGSGYPRGLKGEQIPLAARIFAVVDVWDAIRSDRPYRKAWEKDKALAYILEQSGKHFDPRVVEVFMHFIQSEEGLE